MANSGNSIKGDFHAVGANSKITHINSVNINMCTEEDDKNHTSYKCLQLSKF